MKGFKRFILLSLIAALPVFLFLGLYIAIDPFCIIWKSPLTSEICLSNRGYASTEIFDANYPTEHYDSFILGSSVSNYFPHSEWAKHLESDARIFHFDASNETLEGMLCKLKYIKAKGATIHNVLIIMEENMLYRHSDRNNHLYAIAPKLAGFSEFFHFQYIHFGVFNQHEFLSKFFAGELKRYDKRPIDLTTNEFRNCENDSIIASDYKQFYTPRLINSINSNRPISPQPAPVLSNENRNYLKQIADFLKSESAHYKVICYPRYFNSPINPQDMGILIEYFGQENVCDFTHDFEFSQNPYNYYDYLSHPRSAAATNMLKEAYRKHFDLEWCFMPADSTFLSSHDKIIVK